MYAPFFPSTPEIYLYTVRHSKSIHVQTQFDSNREVNTGQVSMRTSYLFFLFLLIPLVNSNNHNRIDLNFELQLDMKDTGDFSPISDCCS